MKILLIVATGFAIGSLLPLPKTTKDTNGCFNTYFGPGEVGLCDEFCSKEFTDNFNFYYGTENGKLYCICSNGNDPKDSRKVTVKQAFDSLIKEEADVGLR